MKKLFFGTFGLVVLSLVAVGFLAREEGLFSPQQIPPSPIAQERDHSQKRIVGFLPYWQMAAIETIRKDILDEIIYFGIHTNEKGEIVELDDSGNRDLGFARLADAHDQLSTMSLAVILQDNEKIEIFLENKESQKTLLTNVDKLIQTYPKVTGINLDFEYSGIPGRRTITGYTDFVTTFVNELKSRNPLLTVSVDITADAITKTRLYDVENLGKVADYLILMGYDFYRPTSSVAGPVAPLTGKEIYEYDVTTAVSDFLMVVPREKLILGIPYYGWDFPTADSERGSFVEKRPREAVALASYKRARQLIEEGNVDLRFDEESQTPWLIYHDPDTNGLRQVWFEDEVSLAKKYDLVNNERIAGIAIWALGYDGQHQELWNLLEEKF